MTTNNKAPSPREPQCVDCGESPILGTYYYRENKHSNTSVCQICLQENHSEDVDEFEQIFQDFQEDSSHAVANSMEELTDLLLSGSAIRELDFYMTTNLFTPPLDTSLLSELFQRNTTLKSLNVFVRGTANLGVMVEALAIALKNSPSIVPIRLCISATRP